MELDFEPHSWYKGFAIKKIDLITGDEYSPKHYWKGLSDDGSMYQIVEFEEYTLKALKAAINDYLKRKAERDAYNRWLIGE